MSCFYVCPVPFLANGVSLGHLVCFASQFVFSLFLDGVSLGHHLSIRLFSFGFLSLTMTSFPLSPAETLVLSKALVVKQPGDNSCLFHSISFLLSFYDIAPSLHEVSSGFELRSTVCSYIRDNSSTYISLGPGLISTISIRIVYPTLSI